MTRRGLVAWIMIVAWMVGLPLLSRASGPTIALSWLGLLGLTALCIVVYRRTPKGQHGRDVLGLGGLRPLVHRNEGEGAFRRVEAHTLAEVPWWREVLASFALATLIVPLIAFGGASAAQILWAWLLASLCWCVLLSAHVVWTLRRDGSVVLPEPWWRHAVQPDRAASTDAGRS